VEPTEYAFTHRLFAADAGKLGELCDAFATVVRVFEFLPLLRFRARHLADWHRRRGERMVTPTLAEQQDVVARTRALLPRLAALEIGVDRFRADLDALSAMPPMGPVHLARWSYATGTASRLERMVDVGVPAVMLEDFVGSLVDTLRGLAANEPYEVGEVEPPPDSFEFDALHPIQLAEAVDDCVRLCIDPWPEDIGVGLAFDEEPEVREALHDIEQPYEIGTPTPWESTHNPQPRCALHHYPAPLLWRPPGLLPAGPLIDSASGPAREFLEQYPKPIPNGEAGGPVHIAMPAEIERFVAEIDARTPASPALAASLARMKSGCTAAARSGHAIVGWIEYVDRDDDD
jgi:hypothetical protein